MSDRKQHHKRLKGLEEIAKCHGTPVLVIDHKKIRANYREFKKYLPHVKIYYAVKANSDPNIIKTLFKLGSGFDIASLEEFQLVMQNIEALSPLQQQHFIQNRIVYANTIKKIDSLQRMNEYHPTLSYDNIAEIEKIQEYCPNAKLYLRIKVPDMDSVNKLSSKFGAHPDDAKDLILEAIKRKLNVVGLSFHVGSQCTNFKNYSQAIKICAEIYEELKEQGIKLELLSIGGGFPSQYNKRLHPFHSISRHIISELENKFPEDFNVIAEPGRFLVANAATLISSVIGKADREGNPCYYIDDGVYNSLSGIIFDKFKYKVNAFRGGEKYISTVFGPTCDSLDTISVAEELPELDIGDFVYIDNIGAYSNASCTTFNGFSPAKVIHINT